MKVNKRDSAAVIKFKKFIDNKLIILLFERSLIYKQFDDGLLSYLA